MKSQLRIGICMLWCLILTSACGFGGADESNPADTSAPAVPKEKGKAGQKRPAKRAVSPRDAVIASWRKQTKVASYRSTQKSTALRSTSTIDFEYARPNRYHTVMKSQGTASEVTIIGRAVYTRTGNGAWQKAPPGGLSAPELLEGLHTEKAVNLLTEDIRGVELVGRQVLGGTPTRVYSYRTRVVEKVGGRTFETSTVEKLWVAVSDGLPRKHETRASNKLGDRDVAGTAVVTFRDYNADISIKAPIR